MDLFEMGEDGIARIKNESKEVPELKEILKRTKDKERINREIQYVWHTCNSKSPYESYPEDRRETLVIEDFIKEKSWKPDTALLALKAKYIEMQDSPSKRLLRACKQTMDRIATYLATQTTLTEDNLSLTSATMEKIGKIIESHDKVEDRVKKEITTEEKIRGGGMIRSRER